MAKADSKWDKMDTQVVYSGPHITLPSDPSNMPVGKAIEALQRILADEQTPYDVHEVIDAYPSDAAVAFYKAMRNLHGFATPVASFFSKPTMLTVKTGPGRSDVVQVPVGTFALPGVESSIQTTPHYDRNLKRLVFVIHGTIRKKDRELFLNLAIETRRILETESIYRGKALRMAVDDDGCLDISNPPEFLDVSDTSESDVLFDQNTADQIRVNLLTPIEQTTMCVKQKIPLRRGVLLEGPYGVGKSLTARMVANVAQRNGWTFVLLDKVQGLRAALEFATRYQPAVVFAEDIDRIACERDDDMNDLINVIDGVVSKSSKLMTVLTTNHVEKLNPVILRPGRLDAVISLRAPDAATVKRLLRFYAGKLMAPEANLEQAGYELAGQIPASIREAVERAKLAMIADGDDKLSGTHIVVAARTMKAHLALLAPKPAPTTAAEQLATSLQAVVGLNGHGETIDQIAMQVDEIRDRV